ncbi:MAG: IclR family transcriptional regulator [Candidatus Ornithospirochaeta sp.]|nr:IclR family transcriptional regulator [Candidatus Ornithospirochaeta sp.]
MEREKDEEKQMSAVTRTISILEALSMVEAINLENLAKKTELPKATLLRFLSTLISLGYVHRDESDMYHLTLKMFSVGSRSLKHMDLINTAKPFAKSLCQELGETVHMGIPQDNTAVYVLKEESSYTLRMYSRVGKVIPLYCTAIGKIFLSEMSEDDLEKYFIENQLKPFTPKSIRSESSLREELRKIRERGWSIDDEEHEMNIMCLAAPVRDYTGTVIAAISVSWPLFRFNKAEFDKTVSKIMEATRELSRVLGYIEEE